MTSYAWTFGADGSGTGANAAHTFSAAGTHAVTLVVTDDDGATGSVVQEVTVSAPPPTGTASIGDLAGSASSRKGGWTAQVSITVLDGSSAPVAGATVTGTWSTGAGSSCTTGSSGSCAVSLNVNKKAGSVTWIVGGITHATLTYDPDGNLESTIAINRP